MVDSSGLEIRSRVQGHKSAWLNFKHNETQTRKCGLANSHTFLMRVGNDWKVTPGITELSRPRVHIDGAVCYFDVGSSYPGGAENFEIFKILNSVGCQGWGCSPIKRDRELGSERCEAVCLISTGNVWVSERKDLLVREERRFVATGRSVIW